MNFSLANVNATAEHLDYNTTEIVPKYHITADYSVIIIFSVIFTICCIGVPLNGIVIWLLGFQIKRNPFTVLILNLAITDFAFLAVLAILFICYFISLGTLRIALMIFKHLSHILYINGLFLLTAISIDRCVCVFFPIWHRCSRPKLLSPVVCAFLWIFSSLLIGIRETVKYEFKYGVWWDLYLVVTSGLSLPLITISTLILFIKICCKPKQIKRRRLLVMILITLLCFLILSLPLHIHVFIIHFYDFLYWSQFHGLGKYLILGASLNSSINPVIYFLFGRKKRAQTKENIKVIFQRVFREDESPENTDRVSTPL